MLFAESGTINVEERLSNLFDDNSMAWWEMELPSGVVFFHPNKAKMFGGLMEDFVHYSSFTERLTKADYEYSMKVMQEHLEGKRESYTVTYEVKGLDGVNRLLFDSGKVVSRSEDGTIKIAGIIVDISNSGLTR